MVTRVSESPSPHTDRNRLRAAIEGGPFDALIVSSQENTFYATGALILTQREIPLRLALTLWPRGGEPTFIVCGIEESLVRRQAWIGDIRPYVEFAESPVAMIAAAVQERGLARGHLGVEMDHLMARYWDELRATLPDATFGDAGPLLAAVRAVKTPVEIDRLQVAARALERAISHAYTTARPGCTEKWLAETMATALLAEGADEVRALVLSSGPRSVQSHATADGTTPIPPGATIRVDFVGVFGGYLADLARMACIGEPNATQRHYYDGLRAIEWAMIDACRPGTTAADVYAVGKAAYARALGIETGKPHFGHSLGIGLHEEPLIHPANRTPLAPGMVLCIEPTHADPALGGFHIEDTIVVTDGAPRLLSDAFPTDRMVVIA
ncbi:MAG: M24 family metallopeptidase [Thermomicrobiales bacterium]